MPVPPPSSKSIAQKLGGKPGMRLLVLDLPDAFRNPFTHLDHTEAAHHTGAPKAAFDVVLAFAQNQAALGQSVELALAALDPAAKPEARLWIAYPKKSGKIKTDLTRDHGWEPLVDAGWIVIAIAAINETWSAVRFRPTHLVNSSRLDSGR